MGQKAKKITEEQYLHAKKMAFAKSIDGLPKKVAQWVDDSVLLGSRYLFTHRENGVRYGHCTHCHKDVVLELGRTYSAADVQNVNCKHKDIGFCPACKSTVEFHDSGRGRKYMYDQKYILFATKLRDGKRSSKRRAKCRKSLESGSKSSSGTLILKAAPC